MTNIARIVTGSGLLKRRELTREELDVYEKKYFQYIEDLEEKIQTRLSKRYIGSQTKDIIIEKMTSPFEYFLKNELLIEQLAEVEKKRKLGTTELGTTELGTTTPER